MMRLIFLAFWPLTGHSFASGVAIHVNKIPIVITGVFAGFLADEKAQGTVRYEGYVRDENMHHLQ